MSGSVLCAIDVSQPVDDTKVLKKGALLAAMEGATLDVITVIPDFGMSVVGSFFDKTHTEQAIVEAKSALNKLCVEVLGDEMNANIRHIVAVGTAYEEILKTANAAGSELIVIGAHKPDFKDYLLGPNAARVARHATVSVHIVRS
ncbi:universal stress protein [Halocynthiibacter namhaensis]|uniref:universal stress protein n=1 Tax=Halocynthiibacter namhaensis TaxID=1290553 RepID=UPI0005791B8F|nr:universal stress protein [Halocynthiibacter namhaensis]